MDDRFGGRTALITGGASGIGAEFARIVVREGGSAVLVDIDDVRGPAMVAELGDDRSCFLQCDVADGTRAEACVAAALDRFGSLEMLFNNAGIGDVGTTAGSDPARWRRVVEIDLFSVFNFCGPVMRHMATNGGGAIVNNASVAGMFGDYAMSAYNAAKGGVVNLTRSLALDGVADNIRVNVVCPGAIETPILSRIMGQPSLYDAFVAAIPMRRIGKVAELAEVVAFLMSDAASYMTGAVIPVDGGLTCKTGVPDVAALLTAG